MNWSMTVNSTGSTGVQSASLGGSTLRAGVLAPPSNVQADTTLISPIVQPFMAPAPVVLVGPTGSLIAQAALSNPMSYKDNNASALENVMELPSGLPGLYFSLLGKKWGVATEQLIDSSDELAPSLFTSYFQ